ncbi:hypothetical protein ACFOY2_46010 [Nonomuraea purpurea]|uniref:Uncharacterized protein n=1 Tax=Nonomuraea purpurea TaxID=1849276 RepID=A0ABV8GP01_9ACTN
MSVMNLGANLAVVIAKPGYDTVRIGPIPFRYQAEQWISTLDMAKVSTVMPEGTTWEIAPHDSSLPHDDPADLPTTVSALTETLLQDTDLSDAAHFPDLYLRLCAVLGENTALHRWSEACVNADAVSLAEEEQAEPEQAEGNPVNLIRPDANRDEVIAHLDASPHWERHTSRAYGPDYLAWQADRAVVNDIYGHRAMSVIVNFPASHLDQHLGGDFLMGRLAEATNTINAIALRLPVETHYEVIDRFVAIYQAAEPGSPIALIASGQVEPE